MYLIFCDLGKIKQFASVALSGNWSDNYPTSKHG